jgi:hypothetical protein
LPLLYGVRCAAGAFFVPAPIFPFLKNCRKLQYQNENGKVIFEYMKPGEWACLILRFEKLLNGGGVWKRI